MEQLKFISIKEIGDTFNLWDCEMTTFFRNMEKCLNNFNNINL